MNQSTAKPKYLLRPNSELENEKARCHSTTVPTEEGEGGEKDQLQSLSLRSY